MPVPTDPARVRRIHYWLGPVDGVVDYDADLTLDDEARAWLAGKIDKGASPTTVKPAVSSPTPPPEPAPAPAPQPTSPSADIVLPNGGNVQAAINSCPAGGRVGLVCGGSYTLPKWLSFPRDVSLVPVGSGPRPIANAPGGIAMLCDGRQGVTIDGIEFRGTGPLNNGGLRFRGVKNLIIRNCRVTGFLMAITVEALNGKRSSSVLIEKNLIDGNCYQPGGQFSDSHGIFIDQTDDLIVTGNTFDTNGWDPTLKPNGKPAVAALDRNHHAYITGDCGPATVTGNLFRYSSEVALRMSSGGDAKGNLFIDCPVGISYGLVNGAGPVHQGGVSGTVSGNVHIGNLPPGGLVRGWALQLANIKQASVAGNIIAHDAVGQYAAIRLLACNLDPANKTWNAPVGIQSLSIINNRVWDYAKGPISKTINGKGGGGNLSYGTVQAQATWGAPGPDLRKIAADGNFVDRCRSGATTPAAVVAQILAMLG